MACDHHQRLLGIARSAVDAMRENPEISADAKALVILSDETGNQLVSIGFSSDREVINHLLSAARFVGSRSGVGISIVENPPIIAL